ncbi:Zn-ribbon domain-containing OB-fold protein [Rhodoligotrophos defluvii]|uniref:Zn-ribbon domain-containing OB-fold protein n=1 Tax=Rhodoligotrophos defluvii TaxID=2561934 RepID=UPI0010C9A80F|nr:OB-fold domain-containing protein [Rhodoligotrophos defluvii]
MNSSEPAQPRRKHVPTPTPETRHFWDSAKRGELVLQKCRACTTVYFPPRPFCPKCSSRSVEAFPASGRATLYSFVINHRPRPDWPQEPHVIAIVQLEEGPRMVTSIVNVAQTPEALRLDQPLEVVFERLSDDIHLPVFQPREKRR